MGPNLIVCDNKNWGILLAPAARCRPPERLWKREVNREREMRMSLSEMPESPAAAENAIELQ